MTYPPRPKVFAPKFLRALADSRAATELGPAACWLLAVVVGTEDLVGYRPVRFFNANLAAACGLSEDTFVRARARAVRAGWLHYEAGGKGVQGVYWVTVPAGVEGVPVAAPGDFAAGDPPADVPRDLPPQISACSPVHTEICGGNRGGNTGPYIPVPSPNTPLPPKGGASGESNRTTKAKNTKSKPAGEAVPIPGELDTPEFRAAWAEWQAERRDRRKPVTPRAARQQLDKLAPLGAAGAIACVRESIANGWTGLFPERHRGPPQARASAGAKPPAPADAIHKAGLI